MKSGFHECWRDAAGFADSDFAKGTVLDIYNFKGKDKLIAQGVYRLSQVTEDGIPSKNYKDFTWWRSENGVVLEPYDLLKDAAASMLGEDIDDLDDENIDIAEGGAAAAAFSRLQYESLDEKTRSEIKAALLRYCELDTLAMVMIVEAWRAEV